MSNTAYSQNSSPQLNFLQINSFPQVEEEEEESKVIEVQSLSSSDEVEDEKESFPSLCSSRSSYDNISLNFFKNKTSAQNFLCSICQNIPNPSKAIQVQCCHNIFCKQCLLSWFMIKQTCPLCKSQFTNSNEKSSFNSCELIRKLKKVNKDKFNTINNLQIKCPDNCGWNGIVLDYKSHCDFCPEKIVYCKYGYLGCTFSGPRKNIRKHEESNDKYHLKLAKMTISQIKNEVSGKVTIHPHELKFMDSYDWECDGDTLEGGCISAQKGIAINKHGPRFMCPDCKFDLCTECFYYYYKKERK